MFPALSLAAIAFFATPDSPETVPVTLNLHVELMETSVEHLRSEVERIYSPAGILFDWSPENEASIQVVVAAKPEQKIITGCSRNLHDHRLGRVTPASHRITLWTVQVARATAGDWDSEKAPTIPDIALGRALGRVLAHELGHLLLALNGHRSKGLMRASFKHRDLSGNRTSAFRLSSKDIEKVREGVAALQNRLR
jgi:hypothetical protein